MNYIQKNILSPLKELEINAKTGACTIMRTRRQNTCEMIVNSGNQLQEAVNSQLSSILHNINQE